MSRAKGHTKSGALRACAGVGGELERAARSTLANICAECDSTYDLAVALGCTERNARSLLQMYGVAFDTAIVDLMTWTSRRAA